MSYLKHSLVQLLIHGVSEAHLVVQASYRVVVSSREHQGVRSFVRSVVTPHLLRWVSHQDHVKGFLMKQEYTSSHTYKLNLNDLIIKILQFKVQIDTSEFCGGN
jgi:hypothetical protein